MNDTTGTANPLPAAGGRISGTHDASDSDFYSMNLSAGDTVFLSLDLDPERDATTWDGRLGLGLFGKAADQTILIDDIGAAITGGP